MLDPEALLDDVCLDDPQRAAAALQAATGQGEELGPLIVARFESVLAKASIDPDGKAPYIGFLFFLAAEFGLRAAHIPMCAILRLEPGLVGELLGDTITGGVDLALAQTYAGDPAPLLGLIEDTNADVYARGCALDAFARLWKRGHIDREYLLALLSRLADGLSPDSPTDVEFADRVVEVAVHAQTFEIREKILDLYNRDLADPFYYEPEYTEECLQPGAEPACEVYDLGRVLETAWSEVQHWPYFSPERELTFAEDDLDADILDEPWTLESPLGSVPAEWSPPEPYRAPPKIGRNDPCPCGSGKKYKKCCGK